jgi:DNA-binding NtrC family response regulator
MTILIADDNREFCATLGSIIAAEGWNYHALYNPADTLEYLRLNSKKVALLLLDVEFYHPTLTGLDVLTESRKLYPTLPVVMISGTSTFDTAVRATRIGAENFIPKSDISREKICEVVYVAMQRVNEKHNNEATLQFMHENGLIGRSQAMITVAESIVRYGQTDLSILITGETGTGKQVVARAIHKASKRAKQDFVTVDIPNIIPNLFQSELFGHVKSAFTGANDDKIGLFQRANRGTIFFDEIAELSMELQPSLLLPVENKTIRRVGGVKDEEVDVRFVSATDRDLIEAMNSHKFRSQLYHRLREVEIHLPPLRNRREDIPLIAEHYLRLHNEREGNQKFIAQAALDFLQELEWRGNVRQLQALLRRVLQMTLENRVDVRDIIEVEPTLANERNLSVIAPHPLPAPSVAPFGIATGVSMPTGTNNSAATVLPFDSMPNTFLREDENDIKRRRLVGALTETNGNVSKAAANLGRSRETIHAWMRDFGLKSIDFKKK